MISHDIFLWFLNCDSTPLCAGHPDPHQQKSPVCPETRNGHHDRWELPRVNTTKKWKQTVVYEEHYIYISTEFLGGVFYILVYPRVSLWNGWFLVKNTQISGAMVIANPSRRVGNVQKILIDRMNQNLGQLRHWVMCFLPYRSIGNPPELRNLCGILFIVGHRFRPMKMRNAGAPSDPQFDHQQRKKTKALNWKNSS